MRPASPRPSSRRSVVRYRHPGPLHRAANLPWRLVRRSRDRPCAAPIDLRPSFCRPRRTLVTGGLTGWRCAKGAWWSIPRQGGAPGHLGAELFKMLSRTADHFGLDVATTTSAREPRRLRRRRIPMSPAAALKRQTGVSLVATMRALQWRNVPRAARSVEPSAVSTLAEPRPRIKQAASSERARRADCPRGARLAQSELWETLNSTWGMWPYRRAQLAAPGHRHSCRMGSRSVRTDARGQHRHHVAGRGLSLYDASGRFSSAPTARRVFSPLRRPMTARRMRVRDYGSFRMERAVASLSAFEGYGDLPRLITPMRVCAAPPLRDDMPRSLLR